MIRCEDLLRVGRAASERLAERLAPPRDAVGLILGSGLNELADGLQHARAVAFGELPGFPQCSAPGHRGRFVGGTWHGCDVVVVAGRFHAYEGHPPEVIVLPVVALGLLGIRRIVVSNAAGALNPEFPVGSAVLIRDHVNLLPDRPRLAMLLQTLTNATRHGSRGDSGSLAVASPSAGGSIGERLPEAGPVRSAAPPVVRAEPPCSVPDVPCRIGPLFRCPPYTAAWREAVLEVTLSAAWPVHRGVYAALCGPTYETPAEARWLRRAGVDLVGMSSVPEVLAAAALGMHTLAFSLVTNSHARGPQRGGLTAEHVLAEAHAAAPLAERVIRAALATAWRTACPDSTAPGSLSRRPHSHADCRSEPHG